MRREPRAYSWSTSIGRLDYQNQSCQTEGLSLFLNSGESSAEYSVYNEDFQQHTTRRLTGKVRSLTNI
jgi:hypothetical protein